VSGTTVTLVAAGTCTIRASQAGNATYAPAPNVDQSFTVSSASGSSVQYQYDGAGNLIGIQRN
jgi:YD repeat-containing protein